MYIHVHVLLKKLKKSYHGMLQLYPVYTACINRDSYRGGGGKPGKSPPNLSSLPPKILTCCHDLIMYNVHHSFRAQPFSFSSIRLMKNELISTTHESI